MEYDQIEQKPVYGALLWGLGSVVGCNLISLDLKDNTQVQIPEPIRELNRYLDVGIECKITKNSLAAVNYKVMDFLCQKENLEYNREGVLSMFRDLKNIEAEYNSNNIFHNVLYAGCAKELMTSMKVGINKGLPKKYDIGVVGISGMLMFLICGYMMIRKVCGIYKGVLDTKGK